MKDNFTLSGTSCYIMLVMMNIDLQNSTGRNTKYSWNSGRDGYCVILIIFDKVGGLACGLYSFLLKGAIKKKKTNKRNKHRALLRQLSIFLERATSFGPAFLFF